MKTPIIIFTIFTLILLSGSALAVDQYMLGNTFGRNIYGFFNITTFQGTIGNFTQLWVNGTQITSSGSTVNLSNYYNKTEINVMNNSLTSQIQSVNNSLANLTSYAPIAKVNFTALTYNGSLSYNGLVGYRAGHAICQSQFTDSFMCGQEDINDYLGNNKTFTVATDAWIFAGGPKYVPADIPVSDCNGFTYDGIGAGLGNYFKTNTTSGSGTFNAINCQTQIQLACCSRS